MIVMRTTKYPAYSVGELVSSQQSVGFDDLALGVYPLRLYGIEPRTLLGSRQLTILTPRSLFLTSRLCFPNQRLTSLEMCQLALSQIRSSTLLPAASSFSQHHERNRVVM